MLLDAQPQLELSIQKGYIAGSENGIVTSKGTPASRNVYLFDANTLKLIRHTTSLENGHYAFFNLDTDKQYLMIAREIEPHAKNSNVAGWDRITPATDLTIEEQQALWQSWQ